MFVMSLLNFSIYVIAGCKPQKLYKKIAKKLSFIFLDKGLKMFIYLYLDNEKVRLSLPLYLAVMTGEKSNLSGYI